jgi:hypothetical protein
MLRRVVFAAVVLAAGAGLVGQASGQQVVTAGAFCSPQGATGVTSTGIPMTCVSEGGAQARWRVTSEVTTTTAAAVTTTVASTTSTTAQAAQAAQTTTTLAGTGTTTTIPQSVAATPAAAAPLALTG